MRLSIVSISILIASEVGFIFMYIFTMCIFFSAMSPQVLFIYVRIIKLLEGSDVQDFIEGKL